MFNGNNKLQAIAGFTMLEMSRRGLLIGEIVVNPTSVIFKTTNCDRNAIVMECDTQGSVKRLVDGMLMFKK